MTSARRIPLLTLAVTSVGLLAWTLPASAGVTSAVRPSVSATPSLSISGVTDGSAPFSANDAPGEDSSASNRRVRAGDVVAVSLVVTPAGADGGLSEGDVTVEASASGNAIAWDTNQPSGCAGTAEAVRCNFGPRAVGEPIAVTVTGRAAERAASGDAPTRVSVTTGGSPVTTDLTVTAAAPAFDVALTAPRWGGTTTRDGVEGVLVTYGVHLSTGRTTAATSVAGGTTFTSELGLGSAPAGAVVAACSANGEPGGASVFSAAVSERRTETDVIATARVGGGGTWACAPNATGATLTVSGVDTNPDVVPEVTWNRQPLASAVVAAGTVTIFVPSSAIVEGSTVGLTASVPAGNVGDVANAGTAPASRQDPVSLSGVGTPAGELTAFHTVEPAFAAEGEPLTWRAVITNTGSVAVSGVEAVASGAEGQRATAPETLAPGQVFTATFTGQQPAGEFVSTLRVQGVAGDLGAVTAEHQVTSTTPTAGPLVVLSGNPEVGAVPAQTGAKTQAKVFVNGVEFTSLPGPVAVAGIDNLVEYEIKNLGTTALTNVVVEDSSITNDTTAIDCGLDTTNKNRIPSLAGSAAVTCLRTLQPPAGNLTFTVQVTVAGAADATVNAGLQGQPASLDLELLVNGQDADSPPGPSVAANSLLTFGYTLRNSGQIDLAAVSITHEDDEDGVFDDIVCASINDDSDGDANIDLLRAGQSVNCTFTPRAVSGAFSTTATAVGTAVSADGEDMVNEEGPIEVSDEDSVHYTGVAGTGGGTATTTPTETTIPGVIGDGGRNSTPVMLVAGAMFLAGFGLWGLARRRRWA